MLQFDFLEIQKIFEEKKIILGKKTEIFLLQKLKLFKDFLTHFFTTKCFFKVCLITVVMIHIFLDSVHDIGNNSALYLEIAQKILSGGKYYKDFYENDFPLSFIFTLIPTSLAKLFKISPIISLEIFVTLVGILTVYFSSRILLRSDLAKDKVAFNFFIIAVAIGFFLRVFTSSFNEFGTKSTYLLAFAFPYISYHFLEEKQLRKIDQILRGILAGLLFCLKPNYGILVITFELKNLLEKKSFKALFCLRNYITLLVLLSYFLFLVLYFPDFTSSVLKFTSNYHNFKNSNLILVLKEDILPLILINSLCFFLIKKDKFLQILSLANVGVFLVVLSEFVADYDQRFVVYSAALPFLSLLLLAIVRNHLINWQKYYLTLLLIFLVPQFDPDIFTTVIFNFYIFWWIIALIFLTQYQKAFSACLINIRKGFLRNSEQDSYRVSASKRDKRQGFLLNFKLFDSKYFLFFISYFLLPKNFVSWFLFSILICFSLYLSFVNNDIAIIFSAVIFILLVNLYQFLHQQSFDKKSFSKLSVILICLVFSYILSAYLSAVFRTADNTSPNSLNDKMMAIAAKNLDQDDEFVSIATLTSETYPVITYLGKINPLPFSQVSNLFSKIGDQKKMNEIQSHMLSGIKKQISQPKNKIIFIESFDIYTNQSCSISFLEFYLRDAEFRKIFLQNYTFLTTFSKHKYSDKMIKFFNEESQPSKSFDTLKQRIEVYVRK